MVAIWSIASANSRPNPTRGMEDERWSSFSSSEGEKHATDTDMRRLATIIRRRQKHVRGNSSAPQYTTVGGPVPRDQGQVGRSRSRRSFWSVIGRDDRLPVRAAELCESPADAIGLLEFETGGFCTAFLIGPYHAVTAGHCVYNFATKQWYRNMKFWPGKTCDKHRQLPMIWKESHVKTNYILRKKRDSDFGYMLFEKPRFGINWLNFGYWFPKPQRPLYIYGFPEDKQSRQNQVMYRSHCSHKTAHFLNKGKRLKYKCDTHRGMSGSPLLSLSSSGHLTAYSVHTHGRGRSKFNYGAMINFNRFWELVEWIRKTGYNLKTGRPKGDPPKY